MITDKVKLRNFLTIDVEEWFHTVLFKGRVNEVSSLDENIDNILILLKEYKTQATFFVVGRVARKYPGLIKKISDSGHEIASHGYSHSLVYKMSKKEFIADLELSLKALSEILSSPVLGYRACTWSIRESMTWAIDILKSFGFCYDSSIYPWGLSLSEKKNPYGLREGLIEFPPAVFNFLGVNIPFAGGTFLRFFSGDFIYRKIKQINENGYPVMVYLHSWEFDSKIPCLRGISKWREFIQYKNILSVEPKLRIILENFNFSPLKSFL